MMTPNLATSPFLNNRPVWLVAIAALVVALVFLGVNVHLYLKDTRLEGELATEESRLNSAKSGHEEMLRADISRLDRVQWRSLHRQVEQLNLIVRQRNFSWLGLLADVEQVLPREVRLVRIAPSVREEEVVLDLNAIARSREAMLELLENMIEDEHFQDPLPSIEVSPELSATGAYEFVLEVRYLPEGERS